MFITSKNNKKDKEFKVSLNKGKRKTRDHINNYNNSEIHENVFDSFENSIDALEYLEETIQRKDDII